MGQSRNPKKKHLPRRRGDAEKTKMKNKRKSARKAKVIEGSGNVFADLQLADAGDLSIQAELTRLIHNRINAFGLNQSEAAARLGLKQPDVSKLMNGRHTGFSTERLLRLLNALGQDIRIVISPKPPRARREGTLRVEAA